MYFCNCVIISLWKKTWPFDKNKLKSSSPKDAFYQSLVDIVPVVPEKKNLKFRQCLFAIT